MIKCGFSGILHFDDKKIISIGESYISRAIFQDESLLSSTEVTLSELPREPITWKDVRPQCLLRDKWSVKDHWQDSFDYFLDEN